MLGFSQLGPIPIEDDGASRQGFWMITVISDAVLGYADRVSASPKDRA